MSAEAQIRELARKLAAKAAECRALAERGDWAGVRRTSAELESLDAQLQAIRAEPTRTNIVGRVRVDG